MNGNTILTPRRYKLEDSLTNKLKQQPQTNNHAASGKSRSSEYDSQSNGMSSKPQKYLTTYSNLNQISKKQNDLEENFANGLKLNGKVPQSSYNIITHESTNDRYKHAMANGVNSGTGM